MSGTTEAPPPHAKCPLAVWSLVLGILGIVLCCAGPLVGIPAAVCGHIALGRIGRAGGMMQGRGLAVAGVILGYCSLAVALFGLMIAAIAFPAMHGAKQASMRVECINNLHSLEKAKLMYAEDHKGESPPDPDDLLGTYIPRTLVCPKGGAYAVGRSNEPPACSIHGPLKR